MSLEKQARQILDDFEQASPDAILDVLDEVKMHLKNDLTKDYLQGKIDAIKESPSEKKKALCKNLIPYLDWYVQGL